jgi:hypothetical protein
MSIFDPPWVPTVAAAYHPPGLQVAPKISKPASVFGMGINGEAAAHFSDAKNTCDEYKGASNHDALFLPASNSGGNPLSEIHNLPVLGPLASFPCRAMRRAREERDSRVRAARGRSVEALVKVTLLVEGAHGEQAIVNFRIHPQVFEGHLRA